MSMYFRNINIQGRRTIGIRMAQMMSDAAVLRYGVNLTLQKTQRKVLNYAVEKHLVQKGSKETVLCLLH